MNKTRDLIEHEKIVQKIELEKLYLQQSYDYLSRILDKNTNENLEEEIDDVYISLKYLFSREKTKIEILESINIKKGSSYENLCLVLQENDIKSRKIRLHEYWYKKDIGNFIAFKVDTGKSLAFIRSKKGKYQYFDTDTKTLCDFDSEMKDFIQNFAIVVYQSLPNKELSFIDLINFIYNKINRKDISLLVLLVTFIGFFSIITPLISGEIFETIVSSKDIKSVFGILYILTAVLIIQTLLNIFKIGLVEKNKMIFDNSINHAVWDRLLSLPVDFFKKFPSGETTSRVNNISLVKDVLLQSGISTLITTSSIIFNIFLMFYINTYITLFSLSIIFGIFILNFFLEYSIYKISKQQVELNDKLDGYIYQVLKGISKIRVANLEKIIFCKWTEQFTNLQKVKFNAKYFSNTLEMIVSLFIVLLNCIIFYSAGSNLNFVFEPAQFIILFTSFNIVLTEILNLSRTFTNLLNLIPIYNSIKPFLKELKENTKSKIISNEIKGNIMVQNIRFRYANDLPIVLKDISFKVCEGEYIAFVGASGCGKTTLFRLLLGFETLEKGNIYYEEQNLKGLHTQHLRKNIGVVMQNGKLFSDSIYRNIVGYNNYLDENDAWEAAVSAGISNEINNMPMGLHTLISGNGENISGGQKQRILIARALAKKPKIIFLDEATASLDNNSQKTIGDNLKKLKLTRIVIAHRISTIRNVDRIYVIKDGLLAEVGKYNELMDKKGELFKLITSSKI